MAYLLDTNVVSELRRRKPDPHVAAWADRHAPAITYLSVLVVGEIRQGIERKRPNDPTQADMLERWLDDLVRLYRDRILPVTMDIAQEWGRMNPAARPPIIDGLLVATARVHRLTLVTRNVADVARTGVPVANPFEPS
ncbi:MAG TPA: type II toxin-antitoxin system VapC family toxin [Rugosimonospora sp.]|nr:type II toxin-antitoxin system VapC family toxin [Rugosimonospora sp.]